MPSSSRPTGPPRTIAEKIWRDHVRDTTAAESDESVSADPRGGTLIELDRVYLHERQLGIVGRLGREGLVIRSANRLVACTDQQLPTTPLRRRATDEGHLPDPTDAASSAQVLAALERMEATSELFDVPVFGPGDHRGGVLNVVGPEQGMTVPGALVAGTDAHMSTHGAFGALAFVLDDAELPELLATGAVRRQQPGVVRVTMAGHLPRSTDAKDLSLWLLGRLGPGAAAGAVVELGGSAVRALTMDERMTLCNLTVESGAVSAIVEPDEVTVAYLAGRPFVPSGGDWEREVDRWRGLRSDHDAHVDGELLLHAGVLTPQVTWGVAAWQVAGLDGVVPAPDPRDPVRRRADEQALHDQELVAGTPLADLAIDQVFIGSCANARIDDIRAAAHVVRGGRVQVPTWVVPGSHTVARQAEDEGLHQVFRAAGVEWRTAGCSLCIGANGDAVGPGTRLASTANRPQRGMVGPGARVHVLGPAAAAATALTGHLTDPRALH